LSCISIIFYFIEEKSGHPPIIYDQISEDKQYQLVVDIVKWKQRFFVKMGELFVRHLKINPPVW
jgi:hypothetical protein